MYSSERFLLIRASWILVFSQSLLDSLWSVGEVLRSRILKAFGEAGNKQWNQVEDMGPFFILEFCEALVDDSEQGFF